MEKSFKNCIIPVPNLEAKPVFYKEEVILEKVKVSWNPEEKYKVYLSLSAYK